MKSYIVTLAIITCRVSFIELKIIVIIEWYGWINLFSLYNFCFNNGGDFVAFPSISVNLFDLLFGETEYLTVIRIPKTFVSLTTLHSVYNYPRDL